MFAQLTRTIADVICSAKIIRVNYNLVLTRLWRVNYGFAVHRLGKRLLPQHRARRTDNPNDHSARIVLNRVLHDQRSPGRDIRGIALAVCWRDGRCACAHSWCVCACGHCRCCRDRNARCLPDANRRVTAPCAAGSAARAPCPYTTTPRAAAANPVRAGLQRRRRRNGVAGRGGRWH